MTIDEMMREMHDRVQKALSDFEDASGLEVVALELLEIDVSSLESPCMEIARQVSIEIRKKRGWL